VTGIGENTLAQPVKPPLRERRACLAKLVKNRLTLTPRYRDVEPVLRSGQDRAPAGEASGDCGYVRGAGFYGEE